MKCQQRKAFFNHTRNQRCDPLMICVPETLDHLVELARKAQQEGVTVRAIGSAHSWSDATLTGGYLLKPRGGWWFRRTGLNQPLDLEADLLTESARAQNLVRVEAGMRVRELNRHLDEQGLALSQMGGYDGQTVAGVISTSTHGSGIGFGPLNDFVRSLDLVASGGSVYRIEPTTGGTNAQAYEARYPERELVQDDHWFNAAVVGIGRLGLIHSVMLEVEPEYWLNEVGKGSTWSQLKRDLSDGTVLERHRHYEIYINPHPTGGEHTCMVTTRGQTPNPGRRPRDRRRNSVSGLSTALRMMSGPSAPSPRVTRNARMPAPAALGGSWLPSPTTKELWIERGSPLPSASLRALSTPSAVVGNTEFEKGCRARGSPSFAISGGSSGAGSVSEPRTNRRSEFGSPARLRSRGHVSDWAASTPNLDRRKAPRLLRPDTHRQRRPVAF